METTEVVVVGAGVLGVFHALAALRRGLRVVLLERQAGAAEASVRNFGLITSLVGRSGPWGARVAASRALYAELAADGALPLHVTGAMQLAQTTAQLAVLRDFAARAPALGYRVELLDRAATIARNPAVGEGNTCVLGSLVFCDDALLEPRVMFTTLLRYLVRTYGPARFAYRPHTQVVRLSPARAAASPTSGPAVHVTTASGHTLTATRLVVVTTGADVASLLPTVYAVEAHALRLVKLQMTRVALRAPLALPTTSGLSMRRYPCFEVCGALHAAMLAEPEGGDAAAEALGIHVIARPAGALPATAFGGVAPAWLADAPERAGLDHLEAVVGDSHEYAPALPPPPSSSLPGAVPPPPVLDDILSAHVEDEILRIAHPMLLGAIRGVVSRWAGVYLEHSAGVLNRRFALDDADGAITTNGGSGSGSGSGSGVVVREDAHGPVCVVTGIGGKGMSTGPALAEENMARWVAAWPDVPTLPAPIGQLPTAAADLARL